MHSRMQDAGAARLQLQCIGNDARWGRVCRMSSRTTYFPNIPFFFFAFIVPPLSLSLSPLLSIRLNKSLSFFYIFLLYDYI